MKKLSVSPLIILLLFFLWGCQSGTDMLDRTALSKLDKQNFQACLIYEDNELIWEWYDKEWNREYIHIIHSCTKSIVSLLIGTLLDEGLIESVDVPVWSFFPRIDHEEISERNKNLTLRHFLTMTTGLDSRDSYIYRWERLAEFRNKDDWVREILKLKSLYTPGSHFDYSNLASFLLGEIIEAQTGMDVSLYAEKTLFKPLGIETYVWDRNVNGESIGWGGLYLRPSDLAKIGLLVMNRGIWEGRRIVSEQWIEESTTPKIDAGTLREHYGYQWWIDSESRILALGYAGQYLIIDRENNLVTVFASDLDEEDFFVPYRIYLINILPALTGI